MKFEIKSWRTGGVLFSAESESLKSCVELAVKSGAELSGAKLSGANLSCAELSRAELSGAELSGANLSGAVDAWSQVGWHSHGESGRMLTAIRRTKNDAPEFFCGCFTGNEQKIRQYIASGEEKYRASRTLCLETCLMLLNQPPHEVLGGSER